MINQSKSQHSIELGYVSCLNPEDLILASHFPIFFSLTCMFPLTTVS